MPILCQTCSQCQTVVDITVKECPYCDTKLGTDTKD